MLSPILLLVATILPPSIDDWKRTEPAKAELQYPNVAKEFGLAESDAATYANGPKTFTLAVHKLKDVTGAVALEQSLQSPDKKIFRHQNYVFETLAGTAPRGALDAFLFPTLKVDRSAPPTLLGNLPRKGRAVGSERLLLGPESLRAFEPRIPVAAAGFDFAGEVQIAKYGNATLAVLHTPVTTAPKLAGRGFTSKSVDGLIARSWAQGEPGIRSGYPSKMCRGRLSVNRAGAPRPGDRKASPPGLLQSGVYRNRPG